MDLHSQHAPSSWKNLPIVLVQTSFASYLPRLFSSRSGAAIPTFPHVWYIECLRFSHSLCHNRAFGSIYTRTVNSFVIQINDYDSVKSARWITSPYFSLFLFVYAAEHVSASRSVLHQLSYQYHHVVEEKRRGRACLQCLRPVHETARGECVILCISHPEDFCVYV